MKNLRSLIKEGGLKTCYLFYGTEEYIKNAYKESIKKSLISPGYEAMNFSYIDNKKVMADDIIEAAFTMPFLGEKRLIIIKDSGLFTAGRKIEAEKLKVFLSDIPESTCLIFSEEAADKRTSLFKAVSSLGGAYEFKPLTGKELIDWAGKELAKRKVLTDKAAAAYLIRTVGGSMENLAMEFDKLSAYKADGTRLTEGDIDDVCIKSVESRIFELTGALGKDDPETALGIYKNLLLAKESPIGILVMITRQFRLMLEVMVLYKKGMDVNEIARELSERDFIVRNILAQSRNFSEDSLKVALLNCLETDGNIKNGFMADDLAVELLIMKNIKKSAP